MATDKAKRPKPKTGREWVAAMRAFRRSRGLCIYCGRRSKEHSRCKDCREAAASSAWDAANAKDREIAKWRNLSDEL